MKNLYDNPGQRIDMSDECRKELFKWYRLAKRRFFVPYRVKYYGLCYNVKNLNNFLKYYSSYPFGLKSYANRQYYGTMHKCPKRLAFVEANLP